MKVTDVKKVRGCPFPPGVSGNPSGRPKMDPEVKAILKAASPDAARALVELLRSEKDSIRLAAAQDILDRTQGKAIQMQDVQLSGAVNVRGQIKEILTERWRNGQRGTVSPDEA